MKNNYKSENLLPYKNSLDTKGKQVESMFNKVALNYDQMNRKITFGMDRKWRNKVLQLVMNKNPHTILDVATGTGDMAILLAETNAKKILGVDISRGMLNVADQKIEKLNLQDRITTEVQNSEDLHIKDNSFDVVSVVYGIRNFENLEKGLSEMYRVLTDGGSLVILETSVPNNIFLKAGYLFHTKNIMPAIARIYSKDKDAYHYLSDSAAKFPYGSELKKIIHGAGFKKVELFPQFFGASTIYYAEK